ncbi:MAG TPA: ComF family protein [Pyrinomonadaceae bacterium]|jgi:ComF family protein
MKHGEPNDKNSPLFGSPLSALYDACLSLIYPQICRLCEKSVESRADGVACHACWQKTRIFNRGKEILCEKCSAYLTSSGEKFKTFCRQCEDDDFDSARAAGLYEHALLATILNLKKTPFVPLNLQNLFFEAFLKSPFPDAARIIPVPLSKRRFSERGFNQASLLAKILARRSGLPLDEQSLIRKIHTPQHRAGMDRKARVESVRNAFEVTRPKLVEDENILLIDDVFTSGATASNCAKALKNKGARAVYVLTVARAF